VRSGAIVGHELAKRFNWHIGDRITLHSLLWVDNRGSADWPVDIVGFCNAGPDDDTQFANEIYMNYDYFDSARATGKGTVHQFIAVIDDPARASDIAIAIDEMFANSSYETQTQNEKEWLANSLRQTGNVKMFVNSIIGAVMFTLLFLAGNTMSQSVRDRVSELAVLKALGFRDTAVSLLVFAESTLLAVIGAAMGLAATALVFPRVFGSLGGFGPTPLPVEVYLNGLGVAVLMAALSAAIPALQARQLTVAEALAGR
jgi:putative ABC transport system permease protein